jgi:hypothetical protein
MSEHTALAGSFALPRTFRISYHAGCPLPVQAPQPLAQPECHGSFCEFPAINPSQRGQPYRYTYFLSAVRPTNMGNALTKLDLQTGASQTWHTPGGAVGECWDLGWNGGSASLAQQQHCNSALVAC